MAESKEALAEFIRSAGLPTTGLVLNVSSLADVMAAVKGPSPPCWIYGNPVVGLGSGYKPVVINIEPIQPAVLVLADPIRETNPKAMDISQLPPDDQAKVRAQLRRSLCHGIASGVTTALVRAENLCERVEEARPRSGMGQNFLPTQGAFEWRPDRWVGIITRVQSARSASMRKLAPVNAHGLEHARLVVIPTRQSSWGYGLYLRPGLPADAATRAQTYFIHLEQPSPALALALDLGAHFQFAALKDSETAAMRTALGLSR
jgi:hypothetical protein